MVNLDVVFTTKGLTAKEVTDFLLTMDDEDYQAWWPGTHLKCMRKKHRFYKDVPYLGDIVYTVEMLGNLRAPMTGMVIHFVHGKQIVWQGMLFGMRIPVALEVNVDDTDDGVKVRHSLIIGFDGLGKIFDPFIKLCIPEKLINTIDKHAQAEFPKLRDMLHPAIHSESPQ